MVEAIVVTGATATGKTALSVALAHAVSGEIISMDSRQVYRGMDIGTAKPTAAEREGVPHHGFDLVSPAERYSAGQFARDARRWIAEIRARDRVPILVGGSGFFLKALTEPFFEEPPMNAASREALRRSVVGWSAGELERWLRQLDPNALARGGGRQRLARALEVALLTGRPLAWWHAHSPPGTKPVPLRVFVLDRARPALRQRIDDRVTDMLREGLVEEVRGLLRAGYGTRDPGMNATGYVEMIPCLAGETTLDEAAERIRVATRRYARRQATWFRHQLPQTAVLLDATRPTSELVGEIVRDWEGIRQREGEADR
jgi:tRNA dimethylallyltransferase